MTLCRFVFPTHDRVAWLKESIESIRCNGEVEIWILANGCTDGTDEYLTELAAHDPRIHYFSRAENLRGGYYWLLQQFPDTTGYTCLFSDDDHVLPLGFESKRKLLDSDPSVEYVFSRVRMMAEDGTDTGIGTMGAISVTDVPSCAVSFRRLIVADYVPTPTVIMRTSAFAPLFFILSETTFKLADWSLWLHAADLNFGSAYIAEPSVRYRVHSMSDSTAYTRSGRYIDDHISTWQHWAALGYRPEPHELLQIESFALQLAHACGTPAVIALQNLAKMFPRA